jgi:arylsulfatase A-like enzyme
MRRPSLLFIYTDEQRFDTLAAYGNSRIQMPNLNRLAAQSTVFEQAYVTQPVCTPSRSSLLTGLYPHTSGCTRNNIALRPGTPCLPEMIGGGYVTSHVGKWHLGDEIFPQHGFQEFVSIEDHYARYYSAGRDPTALSTYHRFLVEHGVRPADGRHFGRDECARLPEELGKPSYVAGQVCEFLRKHRGEPFALYVNFIEPHMPFFGPRDGQYDPGEVDLPANFNCLPAEDQPLKCRAYQRAYYHNGHSRLPLKTEVNWRRMVANYWGLCSLVDTHVGRILQTLEETGQDRSTIVVFTSDHGDMMGSHRLLAKCVQYQEAIRVPMLVRIPGQRIGRRVSGPVSHIDLVPTLLDLMGHEPHADLEGVSLRHLLDGPGAAATAPVVVEWNGSNSGVGADVPNGPGLPDPLPGWADGLATYAELVRSISDPVRTLLTPDGWKFSCSPLGEHELYDLTADPLETRNLAGMAEHRGRMREMRAVLAQWQRRTGDTVSLPEFGA